MFNYKYKPKGRKTAFNSLADIGVILILLLGLSICTFAQEGSPGSAAESFPILTNTTQIRSLSPDEASKGYPVRITGTVTYYDSDWNNLFIQDEKGAVYVNPGTKELEIAFGQQVLLTGKTDEGGFAPIVTETSVEVVKEQSSVKPEEKTLAEFKTGKYDCEWISLEGVIQGLSTNWWHIYYQVLRPDGEFKVLIPNVTNLASYEKLINARVKFSGVCATSLNKQKQLTGVQVYVQDTNQIEVIEAAPTEPFDIKSHRISDLLRFDPDRELYRRVKVQGIVTLFEQGAFIYLQDSTGGIKVETSGTNSVQRGDVIEAVGFPVTGDYRPVLKNAIYRVTGHEPMPAPLQTTPSKILDEGIDSRLVRIEAEVVEQWGTTPPFSVLARVDEQEFSARVVSSGDQDFTLKLGKGYKIALTGVTQIKLDEWNSPESFQLLVQTPQDIEVLKGAPIFTLHNILLVLVVLVLSGIISFLFNFVLRKKVIKKTRRISEKLSEEERIAQQYMTLVESADEIIFNMDKDGRFISVNQAATKLLGYKIEDIKAKKFGEFVEPEHLEYASAIFSHLMKGEFADDFEADVRSTDGDRLTFEVSAQPLFENDEVVGVAGIARDVTSKKKLNEKLRLMQFGVAKSMDAMFWANVDGSFVYVNESACRLLGYSMDEMLTLSLRDVNPNFEEKGTSELWNKLRHQRFIHYESEHQRKDGTLFPVEISASYLEYNNKEYAFAAVRDITERKRAEDKLKHLSQAVEQSPTSTVITTLDGAIEYANPQFCLTQNCTLSEISGQNIVSSALSGLTREQVVEMWRTVKSGNTWRGEMESSVDLDTISSKLIAISPIQAEDGPITNYVATIEDISERRTLENQVRRLQKLESIGRLAAGVAHDFNNIITVIQGHVGLLQLGGNLEPPIKSSLDEVAFAARGASDLTRQLLAFSRKQELHRTTVDLNRLFNNLSKMLRRLLGEHIALEFDFDRRIAPIHADPGMIEQVLMNLSVNARDSMPRGGELKVRTYQKKVDKTYIKFNPEAQEGDFIVFSMEDTGAGMDKSTISRIFEPFFTTKPEGQGTGLGLATVFGIVKQHSGWIDVSSEVGHGTTFEIFLPAHYGTVTDQIHFSTSKEIEGGTETILVVEDEKPLLSIMTNILSNKGYKVVEAIDGVEAIKKWEEHKGAIKLLITDMIMPNKVSGRQLADRLLEENPELKIIFMSGYTDELSREDLGQEGRYTYISKPFQTDVLLEAVRICLNKSAGR
ncbi:MAG: PAS domain S-box protein [Verrucomicrobia bacterium]|nr:PAS domain S-box protein [Verrucomicrobiota bacterium]MCF7709253.1 PAS domain S-box protein [Verrucomicrobiota bacterium]